MPDVCHTFRAGHRIMVQIQSSWFPLTDRNPQVFVDIPKAKASDFKKATERVYHDSTINVWMM
jgi:predicted acyl esterase